ncbi:MAG TPA: LysE family translocator [Casimicrobiaceae bacterium]|nr:LysE family translocator [Casimicrobiaceae bacterium]
MTGIHDIALFVAAGLMLNVTPGPDMAYIAARSAAGGFRDGAAAVFGITAGCVVHTLAAAIGLSALLATSATAFEIVKWAGALYLFYVGIRLITARKTSPHADPRESAPASVPATAVAPQHVPPSRIFREALLINVFNPKVALFFLAFLPQFIAVDAPDKPLAFMLLGTLFNFDSLFVNLPVAWLASRAGRRWRGRADAIHWMRRIVGGVFVLLAVRLTALSRN